MLEPTLFDVIVIATPGSNRVIPLLDVLDKSNRLKIHIIEATMYSAQNDNRVVDRVGQRALYGHELPDGAIGCAISHQQAYQLVLKLGKGAIILEDDARIPNLENFERLADQFGSINLSGPTILSLLPWKHNEPCSGKAVASGRLFRLSGNAPLTVGYALTLDAAVELSNANPRLKYTADWPPNSIAFLSSIVGVISHGDLHSGSTIQHINRVSGISRLRRFISILLVDYWRYRKEFSSFAEYLSLKVAPSFTWRIDDFRGKRASKKLNI